MVNRQNKEITNFDTEDLSKHVLEKIFPWLLVVYEIEELYSEDPKAAIEIVMNKLDEEKILDQKDIILVDSEFTSAKDRFLNNLESVEDDFFANNTDMFLFKAVSIFENAVNTFFNAELKVSKGIGNKKANEILRKIYTQDKLDWFLTLLCGDSYIDQKGWGVIKPFITTRNYFIHPKPTDINDHKKLNGILTKKSFVDFFDACSDCYFYLQDRRSEESKVFDSKLQKISKLVSNNLNS
ncbi:hypothetical protein [Peribacillus simplex]|uniref:hypothetical protein n=1 Tax=Peribacillus simplex TaxID=1478 RepID=UPI003336EEB5